MHSRRINRSRSAAAAVTAAAAVAEGSTLAMQRNSSRSVALLLTEASRSRTKSMTELDSRPRSSQCLKCGQAAEMCMACANKTARSAVQYYRQARLEGSSNILKSCLTRAGGNHTVKCVVFALWKNHTQKRQARLQRIRTGMKRMITNHASSAFIAWLRFTKMNIHERLTLEVAQQRIALADAQSTARTVELRHNALQEEVDILKREVARLTMGTTQRDRTIATLTTELEREKGKFTMATSTAILFIQLLLTVLAFTTQLLVQHFRQIKATLELTHLSNGLDNFNACVSGPAREELEARVPLLLLGYPPPTPNRSVQATPRPAATAPSLSARRLSRVGNMHALEAGDVARNGSAESVSLGDRVLVGWLNYMSNEAERVFPHSDCGPDPSRLPAYQQLTTLSELSNCQQLTRIVFALLVMRTVEFGQHSKLQVQPPVVPLAQAQTFLTAVESQRGSAYTIAQRILVTVHELFRLPPKLRTAQTILAPSTDRLRVFCNLLMAAFPPIIHVTPEMDDPAEEAFGRIQACENVVQSVSSSIQECKAAESLAGLEGDHSLVYPSEQTIELLRKIQSDEVAALHRSVQNLLMISDRLRHADQQVETLREEVRLGSALALESRKEATRSCLEDLAVLIV